MDTMGLTSICEIKQNWTEFLEEFDLTGVDTFSLKHKPHIWPPVKTKSQLKLQMKQKWGTSRSILYP